jgi:hypothetical protein
MLGFRFPMAFTVDNNTFQLRDGPLFQKNTSPSSLQSKGKSRNKPAVLHACISFFTYTSTLKIEATSTSETLADFQQACFMLVSCLSWSWTLNAWATNSSETSVALHSVISQKMQPFITIAVGTSIPRSFNCFCPPKQPNLPHGLQVLKYFSYVRGFSC